MPEKNQNILILYYKHVNSVWLLSMRRCKLRFSFLYKNLNYHFNLYTFPLQIMAGKRKFLTNYLIKNKVEYS